MRNSLVALLVAGLLVLTVGDSVAYDDFVADWRANYPDACGTVYQLAQECVLCHGGGFSLNAYGDDLASNGIDFALVGLLDSDDDGRTNDQEINLDCTAPGEASSPAAGATWSAVKTLFENVTR